MDSQFQVKITADISELQSRLRAVEAITGKFSQSMDNAAGAVKNMEQNANRGRMVAFAFGQVIRDAGFFSQSFSLGILAISNNIPILIDQISLSVKALQPYAGALSLVGSLLTAGLTIWAYSTQAVKANKEAIDSLTKSTGEEIGRLTALYSAATDVNRPLSDRYKIIEKLQEQYPSYFGNLSKEEIAAGKAAFAYNALRDAIINAAVARASEKQIGTKAEELASAILSAKERELEIRKKFPKATEADIAKMMGQSIILDEVNGRYETQWEAVNRIKKEILDLGRVFSDITKSFTFESIIGDFDSGKKSVSDYSKVLEALSDSLKSISADQSLAFSEKASKQVEAYKRAISELATIGTAQAAAKILELRDSIIELNKIIYQSEGQKLAAKLFSIKTAQEAKEATDAERKAAEELANQLEIGLYLLDPLYLKALENAKALTEAQKAQTDSVTALSRAVGGELVNSFMTMMETGNFSFKSIAQAIGNMIKRLIAAIAAAAILSALLSNIFPNAKNTSFKDILKMITGLNLAPSGEKPLASGGIAYGPTRALIGEYAGARTNPEVVAPLDKLKSIIGGNNGQIGAVIAETRLSGNDLAILIKRADRNRNGNY